MVTALGDGVDSVQVGQRVIAVAPGTLGSHVTTMEDLVVPVPDALSDSEAATFGVAYMTAWHSLREVGRLAEGERVLIHSATGGVGLAAVAIAKMIGARIYATAGSAAKRQLLSDLAAEYVGDSRSVDFADEILEITDGDGVDVILNSLSGEAIRRGVQILAPGGRFIELGKRTSMPMLTGVGGTRQECVFLGRRPGPESPTAAPALSPAPAEILAHGLPATWNRFP